MKRFARSDPRFDLMRLLDGMARRHGASIRDSAAQSEFLDDIAKALNLGAASGTLVHGLRTEGMFGFVTAALGQCIAVKSEDAGEFYSANHDLVIPDYRLVTSAGQKLLVEVKNHHPKSVDGDYRVNSRYMHGLCEYSRVFDTDLYFAVYWSHWGVWTLIKPSVFEPVGGRYVLTFAEALKNSQMQMLGDVLLGTTPPLTFRLIADPEKDRRVDESGHVGFTIGAVEILAGGHLLTNDLERRIAWFLMLFGDWQTAEMPAEIVDGELIATAIELWPEERSDDGQDFEFIGTLSKMLSRQYDSMTSDESGVSLLTPKAQPHDLGVLIPEDFRGENLHLWRFVLKPEELGQPGLPNGGIERAEQAAE